MNRRIEFIESYRKIGNDYQWSDNHGELVRCADCKWFDISEPSGTVEPIGYKCKRKSRFVESDDFCKYGEVRKE